MQRYFSNLANKGYKQIRDKINMTSNSQQKRIEVNKSVDTRKDTKYSTFDFKKLQTKMNNLESKIK